jgi:YegS/Rv2252/BmrU family lipid kinase
MRKAALLYNPASGGNHSKRQAELESALQVLRHARVDAELISTSSRADAAAQTQQAIAQGCDTIFACGGDGTVHDIVQVLATSPVALAILPMGTANALAHDLRIPFNLVAAAKSALKATPRRIALGAIHYLDRAGKPGSRHFTVAAGVGVDAHLFYKLNTTTKKRLGMAAYYVKAWHMWWTYPMSRFLVEWAESGAAETKRAEVTELMAVRIANFGGILQELAPGASLDRDDFRAVFCRTASRLAYLLYVTRGLLRCKWTIPGIDLAYCSKISCGSLASPTSKFPEQARIYVEADGELLGTLPAEITIVPDALTILAPSRNA